MLSQASNLSWEKCLSHWWIKISFVFSGGRNFPQLLIREQILLFYLNLLYVTSNPPKKHQFPRVILILSSYVKKLRKVQKNTKHQVINYLKYASVLCTIIPSSKPCIILSLFQNQSLTCLQEWRQKNTWST